MTQRNHSYLGYSLRIDGTIQETAKSFTVGIGKALYAKHSVQVGDLVEGVCAPVENVELETVDYYKVARFKLVKRSASQPDTFPPWLGVPPPLEVYRKRGHRRLAVQTCEKSCVSCSWGCFMAVEMIIDQWNLQRRNSDRRHSAMDRNPVSCTGPDHRGRYPDGKE